MRRHQLVQASAAGGGAPGLFTFAGRMGLEGRGQPGLHFGALASGGLGISFGKILGHQ